jgi:hypothetical protein
MCDVHEIIKSNNYQIKYFIFFRILCHFSGGRTVARMHEPPLIVNTEQKCFLSAIILIRGNNYPHPVACRHPIAVHRQHSRCHSPCAVACDEIRHSTRSEYWSTIFVSFFLCKGRRRA